MPDRWYVAQSIPRMENWAVDNLLRQGFNAYWPRYEVKVKGRPAVDKFRSVFPGYLFVNFDVLADPWRDICSTRGIRRVLGARDDGAVALPKGFVETMLTDSPSGVIEAPENDGVIFKQGDELKILDGPFAGRTGVMKFKEKGRVALLLTLLGRENTVILPVDRLIYAGAPL